MATVNLGKVVGDDGLTTSITLNGETKTQVDGNINLGELVEDVTINSQSIVSSGVANIPYAGSDAGVIKAVSSRGLEVNSSGELKAVVKTYSEFDLMNNDAIIGKGTLQNYITGKNFETISNKVTSISSSSTDLQYPTAKATYTLANSKVSDVKIGTNTIVTDGVATIPIASTANLGVVKPSVNYAISVNADGNVLASNLSYSAYEGTNLDAFISKGTLENVVAGKLTFANSATVTLQRFAVHTASEAVTSVTFAYPSTLSNEFISEAQFTTGTGTITFGVDLGTVMKGDDCSNGTFTPQASSTYSIIFAYSGTTKYSIVVKVV